MAKPLKFILPIAIILGAMLIAKIMVSSRAPAERQLPKAPAPVVQVVKVEPGEYQTHIDSRGVIQAKTQTVLVAQVSGQVIKVNPRFNEGGFFSANESLVQIDPRDYRSAVTIAESDLVQARQAVAEEEARSQQAALDWQRLGGKDSPSDLTLRKPQLATARANLAAAQARLDQARLNLSRTNVRVPYNGRVLSQQVDLGQVVNPGAVLGEVYATDTVEVRLPLSNRQLAQLTIPEQYRDQKAAVEGPQVKLTARVGDRRHEWFGSVVRSEGAIDSGSRQTFVIAEVEDPYGASESGRPPLKVGQYVEARIEGEVLKDVFVIPASAVRGEVFAYVVEDGNRLSERALDIAWRDGSDVVVAAGLKAGDQLVTTVPPGAARGLEVRLHGGKPDVGADAP